MGRKVLETQEGSPSPSRWINRCACVVGFGVGSKQVTNKDPDADPGVMYTSPSHPHKQRNYREKGQGPPA